MNSAAKKRKIVSHFDEAELEAEEAARAANYALEEVAVKSGGEGEKSALTAEEKPSQAEGEDSPADGDSARENGVFSAHVYPQAMIPYHQPTTERTVYKSETRQRGTLPVLRIELSPTLQKVVDEGRQDMPEEMRAEMAAEKPEISGFGGVNVSLVKPVDADEGAAVAGDVPEKSAVADLAEKPEISEFGGVNVSLVKPVDAGEGAAVAMTAEGTAESEEVNGMDETAVISSDVTPYPIRENFFAMRYYWGAKNWSAYRARLG